MTAAVTQYKPPFLPLLYWRSTRSAIDGIQLAVHGELTTLKHGAT
ncbi:MAG: hypothetical protein WAV85_12170 [Rhodoferax sp.]